MGKDLYRKLTETARLVERMAQTTEALDKAAETHQALLSAETLRERLIERAERRYSAAIKTLGGNPRAAAWDEWTLTDLEDAAALAKRLRAHYGAQVTVTPGTPDAPGRGRRKVMTKGKVDLLIELLRSGANRVACATRLEVSESTITRTMRQHNLKFS